MSIKKLPSKKEIDTAVNNTHNDLANSYLYKMCRENFKHDAKDKIIAKTWLIGRVYAVALERRKNKGDETNSDFYEKSIPKTFKDKRIDRYLGLLKDLELNSTTAYEFLRFHKFLTDKLNKLTDQQKRSFASKYLHFHLPDSFFIYDSRAKKGLGGLDIKLDKEDSRRVNDSSVEKEYATYFMKCLYLQKVIQDNYQLKLTPHKIDNLLLLLEKKQ